MDSLGTQEHLCREKENVLLLIVTGSRARNKGCVSVDSSMRGVTEHKNALLEHQVNQKYLG